VARDEGDRVGDLAEHLDRAALVGQQAPGDAPLDVSGGWPRCGVPPQQQKRQRRQGRVGKCAQAAELRGFRTSWGLGRC
jgi:hypothetical protein